MSERDSERNQKEPSKHLEGEGHAHHQFNPERAEEFHNRGRIRSLKLHDLSEVLDIQSGQTVLDLGTGSGALLPWLIAATAPDGTTIGADISNPMLERAREQVSDENLKRVVLLKNEPEELPLVSKTVDRAVIISSLHEFSHPVRMLNETGRVLRNKATLGILEWRHEEMDEGPPLDHRLKAGTVKSWLNEAGFQNHDVQRWSSGYDLYISRTTS